MPRWHGSVEDGRPTWTELSKSLDLALIGLNVLRHVETDKDHEQQRQNIVRTSSPSPVIARAQYMHDLAAVSFHRHLDQSTDSPQADPALSMCTINGALHMFLADVAHSTSSVKLRCSFWYLRLNISIQMMSPRGTSLTKSKPGSASSRLGA